MQVGIIGLPNVGKSTLFNILTRAGAHVASYPFTTIDRNVGVVEVPDERLEKLGQLLHPERLTPASVRFVDIAGLVKGASKGEGLGNQFLAHIREVDCIVHLVRAFENEDVAHVDGSIDPIRDIETITTELALADLSVLERRLTQIEKAARSGDAELIVEYEALSTLRDLVGRGEAPAPNEWSQHLLLSKPVVYVLNVGENGSDANTERYWQQLSRWADEKGSSALSISVRFESELQDVELEDRERIRSEWGLVTQRPEDVVTECYRLLDLITFYTIKGTETRAWSIPGGTPAGKAAGKIHTDLEKGFIKAEVISVENLLALGSMQAAREAGKLRIEGRDYLVQDGDVILIRFQH